ncbi:lipoprotein-releasing ABC transporter permease subunit [Rhizomicrobium electricum]|uniref:Lipoprotein-releasing ABC transporter permease subunit n=1 Tax=Rhizomicrobium electricum TaxID=480070 RepID=A0ABP3PVS9_9PROT|nr:lipoprotein-releasing ABC transporter permease subunit [Rhizomicrobium electricum]NIJ48971.1 lipoprotein-releasing system permease protein [Rhizomicrobium electricum]
MKSTRPFSPFEWMLALRYLRAKRAESFISIISVISLVGIALGVAVLIIVMAVMNGFRHDLMGRILGIDGHIMVQSASGQPISDYDALAARIAKVKGVTHVTPMVQGFAAVDANGVATGVQIRGIRRADVEALTMVSKSLPPAALRAYGEDTVLVGARLAQRMGLYPGSDIKILGLHGDVTPFGTMPRAKVYSVAGLFTIGMSEYDKTIIYMPLSEAQMFFNYGDAVPSLEVMTIDPDKVDGIAANIEKVVGSGVRVLTWRDTQSTFFDAVQVERNVMALILTLIVVVAALNIVSGLYMLVKDKSPDIAILRTMGATRGAVMRVFLITGMSIGVSGTFIGFLIGVLFCKNIEAIRQILMKLTGTNLFNPEIYFLSHMPALMDPLEVAVTVFVALLLSFLATLYPAWRAARLDPVEALRYE